jgi:ethanolamine utilization protein EutN
MILGRVVGEVWATRKDARLERSKLLVVRPHGWYQPRWQTRHLVAVDEVHAGVGDDVVLCLGQPARWSLGGENFPVDAAVMAIVDRVDLDEAAAAAPHAGPGIRRSWQSPRRWAAAR